MCPGWVSLHTFVKKMFCVLRSLCKMCSSWTRFSGKTICANKCAISASSRYSNSPLKEVALDSR